MTHVLPSLPYPKNALAPVISSETLDFHHGKHHQAYVDNLNKLIVGTEFQNMTLEQIITKATGPIFNNAAQVWNHTFYFSGLHPAGGSGPAAKLAEVISRDFGSFDAFKQQFNQSATTLFGSGWCWLVKNQEGKLQIVQTSNAANPMTSGQTPVLTCDVWEHAYYIDYRNARAKYLESFWTLVNWEQAQKALG